MSKQPNTLVYRLRKKPLSQLRRMTRASRPFVSSKRFLHAGHFPRFLPFVELDVGDVASGFLILLKTAGVEIGKLLRHAHVKRRRRVEVTLDPMFLYEVFDPVEDELLVGDYLERLVLAVQLFVDLEATEGICT